MPIKKPTVQTPSVALAPPEDTTKKEPIVPPIDDNGQGGNIPQTVQPTEYYEGYNKQVQNEADISANLNVVVQTSSADIAKLQNAIKNPLTLWFRRSQYQEDLKRLQADLDIAIVQLNSSEWRLQVLASLPAYLASPRYNISSIDDIIKLIPNSMLDNVDRDWLQTAYDQLSYLNNKLPADYSGSLADAQNKIVNEILVTPPREIKSVHNLTVNELEKTFQSAISETPAGMTTEQVVSTLSRIELDSEADIELSAWLTQKSRDWEIETARVNLIKSVSDQSVDIDLTPGEFFNALVVQPFMATVELLDKYAGFVVRPLAAGAIIGFNDTFSSILPQDTVAREMKTNYNNYLNEGKNAWEALSLSFSETEMPWWMRMLEETAFDPTTYIGTGLATHAAETAGTMLTKIGAKQLGTRIGPFVGMLESGYVKGADALFNAGKELVISPIKGSFWLTDLVATGVPKASAYGIPKTVTQMSRNFARMASMNFKAVLDRTYPDVKNLTGLTAKDIRDTASACIDAALTRPGEGGDLMVRAGSNLLEFNYIDADAAEKLFKGIAKDMDFDPALLTHINNEILNMFSGQSPQITAGNLLGVEQTEDALKSMISNIGKFKDDIATAAKNMFNPDEQSDQLIGMFEKLSDTRYNNLSSPIATHVFQAGETVSWVSRVADRVMQSSILINMERKVIMPFARWNLLFTNFGPMNFFENMQRSFLGGGELMFPKSYGGVAETNRLFRGLTNAPYELQMAERGSQRLEAALLDPKTGSAMSFRGGKIPFVTKEVSVGGKVIGKRINIRGKDFKLTDMQSYNDMWEEATTIQRAYDYQVHYMKALPETAPEEMRTIIETVDKRIKNLDGMTGLSKRDIQDIRRTAIETATIGPDEFRHIADMDVLELQRRTISKNLGKVFDKCTDVRALTKKGIRDEVLDGSIFKDIGGRVEAYKQAERDLSLVSLANQIDALKGEADNFIKAYTNTGTLLDELSQDIKLGTAVPDPNYKGMVMYPIVLDGQEIGHIIGYTGDTGVFRVDQLQITKPGFVNKRNLQDIETVIHNEANNLGATHVKIQPDQGLTGMYSKSGYKLSDHGFVSKPVMKPASRAPETLDDLRKDMDNISALHNAVDERIHDYRRLVELRSHNLKPGKEVDDFHVGSNKLMSNFMDTSKEQMNRIIDGMNNFLDSRPTILNAKGEKIPILGMTDSQMSAAKSINEIYRQETANILNTRNRLAVVESKIQKTPAPKRDSRFWQQQRAEKAQIWDEHEVAARRLHNLNMDASRQFLSSVGKNPFVPTNIPAVTGALTPSHIAHLFGATGDDTYRGLTRIHTHVTVRPKEEWIDYVKNQANAYAQQFQKSASDMGFTDQAIGDIYDQLWRNCGLDPKMLTPDTPTILQLDEIKQELTRLHAATKMDETDLAKWRQFNNGMAEDLEKTPMYSKDGITEWFGKKESAMKEARKQHELAYPTYDDANVIDESMRAIFPFWTYELFRQRWLPRTFMRTPGTLTAMARFMDNTDGGYVPIPGTDLQINPLRGSIWAGGMRRFYSKDFPEYYDKFPGMQFIDAIGRAGFYPGVQVMAAATIWGQSTNQPEWNELVPTWMQTGLSALRALSPEHIGKVIDYVFPDRFRDYNTMLTLGEMGYDVDEIWNKKKQGLKITPEEEKLWLRAEAKAGGLKAILMEQTGMMRLRPREYDQMKQEMQLAIQDATGVSVKIQQRIDRLYPVTGKRFSDYYKLDVLQTKLLYESESYRRWQGVATPLSPSSMQLLEVKIKDYWDMLEKNSYNARHVGTVDELGNMITPSIEELNRQFTSGEIGPDQWKTQRSSIQSALATASEALGNSPAYKDVPKTLEERAAWLAEKGTLAPTYGPDQELLWYYYQLEPEVKYNWDSDRMEPDFDTYYAKVDMLLESLSPAFRQRLLDRIQMDWTPMERLYWDVSREYFRSYRNIRTIVLNQYTDEEKQQIRRFEVARGDERTALQEVLGSDGEKLISGFNQKVSEARKHLRYLDPTLDAWSYFFGNTDSFITKEAEDTYKELTSKYMNSSMIK